MNKAETTLHLCEMQRLMDAKGIEDLEELHECFLEQGPEGIDALWTCECFCRYAAHEVKDLYPEFMVPLVGALEATEERQRLLLAWLDDATDPRHLPQYREDQGRSILTGVPAHD